MMRSHVRVGGVDDDEVISPSINLYFFLENWKMVRIGKWSGASASHIVGRQFFPLNHSIQCEIFMVSFLTQGDMMLSVNRSNGI